MNANPAATSVDLGVLPERVRDYVLAVANQYDIPPSKAILATLKWAAKQRLAPLPPTTPSAPAAPHPQPESIAA